ncbi:MucBP domain-containing protein [Lactobacillus sp. YT155]|uniref:MucBP domain-containing protein n=1 Tax=Lactobacillus sp. YT155 TaxID=3060955 RepID=UPI00265FFDF9|nr:MucBP domain-containing protein [Lactobacillus sp. YT155]MDO1605570.1 MucBP domain-containing protein [Lactobacillus sp. YT155]
MGKKRSFFTRAVISIAAFVMVFGSSGVSSAVENLNAVEENTTIQKNDKNSKEKKKNSSKEEAEKKANNQITNIKPAAYTDGDYKVASAPSYNASWPYNNIIGRNVDMIKNGSNAGYINNTINGGFTFVTGVDKFFTGYGVNGDNSGAANVIVYNDVLNFGSDTDTVVPLDSSKVYLKNINVPLLGNATKVTVYGKSSTTGAWKQVYSGTAGKSIDLTETDAVVYTKVVYENVTDAASVNIRSNYNFTASFLNTINGEPQNTYPHTVSFTPGLAVQNAANNDWAWKYNGSTYQIPDSNYPEVKRYNQIGAAYSVQQSIDTKDNRVVDGTEVLRGVAHFRIMNWLSLKNEPGHNPNPVKFTKKKDSPSNKDRYETTAVSNLWSPGGYQNLPINELTYVLFLPTDIFLGDLKVGDAIGTHNPYGTFNVKSINKEMVTINSESRQKVTIGISINNMEYMYGPNNFTSNIPLYTENVDKFTSYTEDIKLTYPTRLVVGGYDQLARDNINNTGYWYKDAADGNTPDSSKLVNNGKNDWVFGADAVMVFPRAVKVTYDANGGTGSVTDDKIYPKTQDVTVKSNSPLSRPGYTFTGWKDAATGDIYQPNNVFEITADTTLVAQWERAAGAPVTVNYVDEAGNKIATSDTLNGKIDDPYSTSAKTVTGWVLKTTPANATGKFTSTAQTVTYVYTRAAGAPVTVNYVDEDGNKLTTSDVLNGKIDDPYSTSPKTITNWEVKTTPANAKGKFTDTAQTVTYVYTKKAGAPVTVNYVDEAGNKIATSETLNGKIDDPYTSSAKTIANWVLKTTPANATGKFTTTAQTVTYVYTRAAGAPVTVNYVDEAGNKLATSDVLNGKIDDPYSTSAKTIADWELKTTPANATGKFTTTAQTVTYVYTKKAGAPITVRFVDEAGNELATSNTLNGKIGDAYSTIAKDITDWTLITTPANASGTFTYSPQTVTYVYRKNDGAAITVKYVDEEGNELATSETLNGKIHDPYTTVAKDITDWTLTATPANATGTFTYSPQMVVYVYMKNDGAPVNVKYVDEEGNELADSETLNGKIHDPYTTTAKDITDWTLIATPDNADGKFTYDEQTVTYVYRKNDGAAVTVKYVDEKGKELATSDVLNGKIHDPYTTTAKKISGWNLKEVLTSSAESSDKADKKEKFATVSKDEAVKKEKQLATVKDSTSGVFTYDPQTVTYVYSQEAKAVVTKPTPKKVDPKKLPRTGDNTQNNVLSILGLISLVGIAVYMNSKKRKA